MTTSSSKNPAVLLGIGGGVAAYKAVQVASSLRQNELDVTVAMSSAATKFITPLTFAAVTNRNVLTNLFSPASSHHRDEVYPHLYPATEVDCCVILPATADLIAKIVHGLGDDIVSTSVLSLPLQCRRYFCPAMNVEMWNQSIVQDNVAGLEAKGWQRIGPESGHLACGATGQGRMSEPEDIIGVVMGDMGAVNNLQGKRLLILSGPTVEHIDPVRFISNHSSGKMGKAIAEAAIRAGAKVEFVTGPVAVANIPVHPAVESTLVTSAEEMLRVAGEKFDGVDAAVFVAAVADFAPTKTAGGKMPKTNGGSSLELMATPDIAAALSRRKRNGQVCIGFALETGDDADRNAREKLGKKSLDGIVLNTVESFGADTGNFQYLSAGNGKAFDNWGKISKVHCADRIVGEVAARLA